jgi:hypothetical protein
MAERLPFSGTPLPTGLPGVGGSTVEILILPGFNTVVAAQTFGPTVDAPEAVVPSPIPPEGSNPDNPTTIPVSPAPPPPPVDGSSNNFCERCVPPTNDVLVRPLYFADDLQSGCTDCQGDQPGNTLGPEIAMSEDRESYVRYYQDDKIGGTKGNIGNWSLDYGELSLTDTDNNGVFLTQSYLNFKGNDGETENDTKYQSGPEIIGDDGKHYTPQDLQVCVDGSTETWKVLAYKP